MTAATPRPARPYRATVGRMGYPGRHGAPRPPAHIEADMMAAGRNNDPIALGLARALYEAWLADQGIAPDHHTGSHVPDEAFS